jgi:hypothetical protein
MISRVQVQGDADLPQVAEDSEIPDVASESVEIVEREVNIPEPTMNAEKSPEAVSEMAACRDSAVPIEPLDVVERDGMDPAFVDPSLEAHCEDDLADEFDDSEEDVEHVFRPLRAADDVTFEKFLHRLQWGVFLADQLARRGGVGAIRGNGTDSSKMTWLAEPKGSETFFAFSAIGVSNWSYCSRCERMCFVRVDGDGLIVGHRCRRVSRDKSRRHRSRAKKAVVVPKAPLAESSQKSTTPNEKAATSEPTGGLRAPF